MSATSLDRSGADDATWPWPVAVVLATVGVVVNAARPTAGPVPAGVPDLARFDPALLAAIEAYRTPRIALLPVLLLVPLAVAWSCTRGRGPVPRVVDGGDGSGWSAAWRGGVAATVIVALAGLAVLPVRAWLGLVHEARWGFRTSTTAGWWSDAVTVSLGRWVTVGVAVAALVWTARRWPRSWPARITIAVGAVAYGVVLLHPTLLQPLLLTTEPLPEGELREELEEVVAAAGVEVPLVVGDASRRTTRFNAVVVGIGPTEQVVLFDTLLELPTDQIVALVAHELAHQQHRDLLRGTALAPTVVLPAALGWAALARRRRPSDRSAASRPQLVPLLVAVGLTVELLSTPVVAGLSRRVEAAADEAAYDLGADPGTAIALFRAAVVRDLAAPDPPAWLWWPLSSHPTPTRRIAAATDVAATRPEPLPSRSELERAEDAVRHPRAGERTRADAGGGAPTDGTTRGPQAEEVAACASCG